MKGTRSSHWTTIGGSIAESTRIPSVKDVYPLFDNLGETPPVFRARPYQDCTCDITVTHSPRYLINMDLKDNEETIFTKMGTTYEEFRTSSDPISTVRSYYRQKAIKERKGEFPWWISSQDEQNSMMVKSYKSLPHKTRSC